MERNYLCYHSMEAGDGNTYAGGEERCLASSGSSVLRYISLLNGGSMGGLKRAYPKSP